MHVTGVLKGRLADHPPQCTSSRPMFKLNIIWEQTCLLTRNFFCRHDSWIGYVLRVGVLWFSGPQFALACYFRKRDGLEFTFDRMISLASYTFACGVFAGFGALGLAGISARLTARKRHTIPKETAPLARHHRKYRMCESRELISLATGFACACGMLGGAKLRRLGTTVATALALYRMTDFMA